MISSNFSNLPNNNINANSPKIYSSLQDFSKSLVKYGENQTKIYENKFKNDGSISIEELKQMINNEFPKYQFTSSNPSDPINGQHLLYIDDKNLQKMANDSDYIGLMKREYSSLDTNNKIRMGVDVINSNITGSVFSLSNENENVGGVPYKGMAMSVPSFDTSSSFVIKNTNTFGGKDDWFEELLKKLQEKKEEQKRLEIQKQRNELLNIKI